MTRNEATEWPIVRSCFAAFCLALLLLVPGSIFPREPDAREMEAQQTKSAAKLKARCLRVWGVQGVNGRVLCVAFGRDSKMVAANYDDGFLCIWDDAANEDKMPRVLNAGQNFTLGFSSDGKEVITGTGPLEWWDVAIGKKIKEKKAGVGNSAHFSPDCTLVAGFRGTKVKIADLEGNEVATLPAQAKITAVAFSPDNKDLAVAEWNGGVTLRWWNIASGKDWKVRRLSMYKYVTALAFSGDGKVLAAGGRCSPRLPGLWIFDTRNPQWHQEYYPNPAMRFGACEQLALSPDGRLLIGDGKVWDLTTKKLIAVLEGCGSGPMVVSPDGKKLAVAAGGSVQVFDLPTPSLKPCP